MSVPVRPAAQPCAVTGIAPMVRCVMRDSRRRGDDRSFWTILLLVAGPLLQAGGWAAAFTDVGAVFVIAGSLLSLAGFGVTPRPLTLAAALVGLGIGGWAWFALLIAYG